MQINIYYIIYNAYYVPCIPFEHLKFSISIPKLIISRVVRINNKITPYA